MSIPPNWLERVHGKTREGGVGYWMAAAFCAALGLAVGVLVVLGPGDNRLSIALRQELAELLPGITSISIDVRDMDPQAYKKRLLDSPSRSARQA